MPFLSHELITQRAQNVESGKLKPILFDSSAAQRITAPQVNVNAGSVKFSPVDQPRISVDTTIQSLADMSKTWVDSALKYQDTVDTITAEEQLLKTELAIKEVTNKYLQTTSGAANKGYDAFRDNIATTIESTLSGIPDDSVKAKVIPGLAKLKNQAIISGSDHNTKQTAVWQDEIVKAKEVAARQNLVALSDDPTKFMPVVGQHLQVIGAQQNKSKEAILLEQNKFYSDILSDAISTHIMRGTAAEDKQSGSGKTSFDTAKAYINIGMTEAFKADGLMLAKQSAAIEQAISQANKQSIAEARYQKQLAKERIEEQHKAITMRALAERDPKLLNAITDPAERAKAIGWFDTITAGTKASPATMYSMLTQMDKLAVSPSSFLEAAAALNLNVDDAKFIYGKLDGMNKETQAQVLKEIKDFAHAMVPGSDPITNKYHKAEQEQQFNAIYMRLVGKVREAEVAKKASLPALYDAQAEIFADPNFKVNFQEVQLTRPLLSAAQVEGITDNGMFSLDTNKNLKEEITLGDGKTKMGLVDYTYNTALVNLNVKYNLQDMTRDQFIDYMTKNPQKALDYSRDVRNLEMQRRYFLNESAKVNVKVPGATEAVSSRTSMGNKDAAAKRAKAAPRTEEKG